MSTPPEPPTNQAEVLDNDRSAITLDAIKLRLAQEIAPYGWRRGLDRIANQVEKGQPLDQAFNKCNPSLPDELRCLMQAAMDVPDPASLVVEALRTRGEIRKSWNELTAMILYPVCLFVFALGVGVAFTFTIRGILDLGWIEEFGLSGLETIRANIQDQHHAIVGLGLVTVWIAAVLLTVAFVGPTWAWTSVVGGMVVVGPPLRWLSMQEILHRYSMFLGQRDSTADAARAVARSFSSSSQSIVARGIASRIEAGVPIGQALGSCELSDGLCRPVLLLIDGDRIPMAATLTKTAELLGRLAKQRCQTLATILPVFVLAMVGTILWASFNSYLMSLMPLIRMITELA